MSAVITFNKFAIFPRNHSSLSSIESFWGSVLPFDSLGSELHYTTIFLIRSFIAITVDTEKDIIPDNVKKKSLLHYIENKFIFLSLCTQIAVKKCG